MLDLTQDAGKGVATLSKLNPSRQKDGFRIDADLTFLVEDEEAAAVVSKFVPGALELFKSGETADNEVRRGLSSGNLTGRPKMPPVSLNLYDPADDTVAAIAGHDAALRYCFFAWDGPVARFTVRARFDGLEAEEIGFAYAFLDRVVEARFEAIQQQLPEEKAA